MLIDPRDDYNPFPKANSVEDYIEEKLQLMTKELMIRLTAKEVAYMRSLKSEIAADNAARTLIIKHWEAE